MLINSALKENLGYKLIYTFLKHNYMFFVNRTRIKEYACKSDGLDISAVTAKDGTPGHVLLSADINRSKDSAYHIGKGFISDSELRKNMN